MTTTEKKPAEKPTDKAPPAKKYYATRNFNDAGTERSFAAGDDLKDIDAGAVANYAAAGLASTEKPKAETPAT